MNRPEYAMLEVRDLISRAGKPLGIGDPVVRYLCALFAELAYHHVPQWEIDDDRKRAKVIPSRAYQTLARRGIATNALNILFQAELGQPFVAEDRGVIAVGLASNDLLFIGFRGTRFWSDWNINARSRRVAVDPRFVFGPARGRLHSGFAEEALRISKKVEDSLAGLGIEGARDAFLSGHSLGGAVAAIASYSLHIGSKSVCIFGAPRYSDLAGYMTLPSRPPTHVRRRGDVVPTVPPRWLGYVDHPYEFTTDGRPYFDPKARVSFASDSWRWGKFIAKRFRPHLMEAYRGELEKEANASGARLRLTDFARL